MYSSVAFASAGKCPALNVSYKPQKISPKSDKSVRMLLHEKIQQAYTHPQFVTDVLKPLQIEQLFDQEVKNLSGTRTATCLLTLTPHILEYNVHEYILGHTPTQYSIQ